MSWSHRTLRGGFTVLETLIAALLLTVGVVALCRAFSLGLSAFAGVEDVDRASNIARAKMAEVKNTAFASLSDSGPTADPYFSGFNVTVDVAEGQNPMQVDVIVGWSAKGGEVSINLTTLVADF